MEDMHSCLDRVVQDAYTNEKMSELANIIIRWGRDQGLLLQVLEWLLERELRITVSSLTLFREDCFLMAALGTIYSDSSNRYLQQILKNLIIKLEQLYVEEGIILQLRGASEANQLQISSRLILIMDEFLQVLLQSTSKCSLELRQVFATIQRSVQKKFPEVKTAGLDLLVFRFICPAIISPVQFNVVPQMVPEVQRSVITFAKVLNDMALDNDTKWGETLDSYIETNHSLLAQYFTSLTDEKEIATLKRMVDGMGNFKELVVNQSRIQEKFFEFLQKIPSFCQKTRNPSIDLPIKETEFLIRLNDQLWRHDRRVEDLDIYALFLEESVTCFKSRISVDFPMQEVSKAFVKFLSEDREKFPEIIHRSPDESFQVVRSVSKSTLFSDRETVLATWLHKSDNRVLYVVDDTANHIMMSRHVTRVSHGMAGVLIERDGKDKTSLWILSAPTSIGFLGSGKGQMEHINYVKRMRRKLEAETSRFSA